MSDAIKHECGIAVLKLKKPLAFYKEKYGTSFYGLNKMYLLMEKQHNRGQDGAGLANIKYDVKPGNRYISRKRSNSNKPIQDIFADINRHFQEVVTDPVQLEDPQWVKENLPFSGEIFLGHLRYGTFGRNSIEHCHPFLRQSNWMTRNLVLAGNFNLTNVDDLFTRLVDLGQHPKEFSDTVTVLEKIGHFLDRENEKLFDQFKAEGLSNVEVTKRIAREMKIENILQKSAEDWDGGYAMAGLLGHGDAFVFRDPNGIRPAFYYQDDEVVVVASERPVIQTAFHLQTEQIHEITPGCALIMKRSGDAVEQEILPAGEKMPCSFERIYFSRGSDRDIYLERKQLGSRLSYRIHDLIGKEIDHTVFSFVPNTAEIAFYGLVQGMEELLLDQKLQDFKNLGNQASEEKFKADLATRLRVEKVIVKDAKLRTFISDDEGRDDLVSHVYDIAYGTVVRDRDNLVVLDDSIVRGTTLKKSILRILDRLGPRRIIVVSSAPMICYPDCYGIDMAKLGDFVAFQAAIELLKEKGKVHVIDEVYENCKAMLLQPKEENRNEVMRIYAEHTQEEMEKKISELLTPVDMNAEVRIVFQSIENLHEACPNHRGSWYFNGEYPTPGGNKVVNRAFVNYYEGKNVRAY